MEWTNKLETRSDGSEVDTFEVGRIKRRVMGLAAEELGLSRFEGKEILSELQCLVLQTWIEEFTQGRTTRPVRNMLNWLRIYRTA